MAGPRSTQQSRRGSGSLSTAEIYRRGPFSAVRRRTQLLSKHKQMAPTERCPKCRRNGRSAAWRKRRRYESNLLPSMLKQHLDVRCRVVRESLPIRHGRDSDPMSPLCDCIGARTRVLRSTKRVQSRVDESARRIRRRSCKTTCRGAAKCPFLVSARESATTNRPPCAES